MLFSSLTFTFFFVLLCVILPHTLAGCFYSIWGVWTHNKRSVYCDHGTIEKWKEIRGIFEQKMFRCWCEPGWGDHHCATDINECASSPCQNEGSCEQNTIASYNCKCPQGFSGKRCQDDVMTCRSNPCKNRGTCRNFANFYTCQCRPGVSGKHCERDGMTCRSNPCWNGGTCRNFANYHTCQCRPGFSGKHCERGDYNECWSNPCQKGGTCTDHVNRYTCRCPPGFTGVRCEENINECDSSPCRNKSPCKDEHLGYKCECLKGFEGRLCGDGTNDCDRHKCKNGATCIDGFDDYECKCLPSFTGTHCDTEMVLCTNDNCVHGDCGEMYRCSCNHGYTGAICDTAMCNVDICDMCNVDEIQCDQCNPTRTGKNCETELCGPLTCLHGECSEDFQACRCEDGYTGTKCDQEPGLTVRIKGYNGLVNEGEQLALQCVPSDEETKFSFTWRYTTVDGNVSNIAVTQNLTIQDVKPENEGNYLCYIVDATQTISSEDSVTVEVRKIQDKTEAQTLNNGNVIPSKPLIGISSVLFIVFLVTASYLVWKRRSSQRKIDDNGVEDIIIDDLPSGDSNHTITPTEMETS